MVGMIRQARMTVGRKIYALICLSCVGLLGITFLGSRELASSLIQQKQIELQHLGEVALGIVKEEHAAVQKGDVSAADAQKRAMARVAALRYGSNDYYWINDMHPKMVMHPIKPEMNGNDLSAYKDPNGKLLFVDFVDTVRKNGAGFVPYEWPKPGFEKPQPKLSYVVGFAPWNWVIGTGVYIDDLNAQTWTSTQRSLLAAGLIVLFALAVSILVARSITGPLRYMTAAMNDLASGNLAVEVPGIGRGDEVGEMAKAVEIFKGNAVARQALEAEQREAAARAASGRKADMNKMAGDFEAAVGQIVEAVSSASSQLEVSAGTLTTTAENFGDRRDGLRSCCARSGRRTDQHHRRPDQSAGAQRHHRGGAGRRGRPRLRRCRIRSEGPGGADRKSDRRDRPADIGHPGGDAGIGECDPGNQRHHREAVGDFIDDCRRGGRAGRGDAGNLPQRAAGLDGNPAGLGQHYRRAARRRRNRFRLLAGACGGAIAVG